MRASVVFGAALAAVALAANPPYNLVMVNGNATGAWCLDGSQPGFYWAPGSGADSDKWMIYHQGGGWCYNEEDCLGRSRTNLGSSTKWPVATVQGGMMSNDCSVNPGFCNWNKVYMIYCDGYSFSGDLETPLVVNGTTLYMRGKRVLDTLIEYAATNAMKNPAAVPLAKASRVVVTGCSAGGLATYMHADYVKAKLASLYSNPTQDYRVISISGYFQDYTSVSGTRVYTDQIQYAYAMQNVSATNDACVAANAGQEWKCGMAPYVYPYIQAPFFALNSVYDSWQSGCVLTSEPVYAPWSSFANGNCSSTPGWTTCAKDPTQCNATQLTTGYIPFGAQMRNTFSTAAKYKQAGNGGFLTSCHTHCEAQSDGAWQNFAIGGVTMRDAVWAWMNATTASAPAWYVDCAYRPQAGSPYCNPSCSA